MLKIVLPQAFGFSDPIVQLVKVHSKGIDRDWMKKRASVCFEREFETIEVPEGYEPAHVIAIGDFETYGMNRNGDSFLKKDNVERHHTFQKFGHHFHHHNNSDPKLAFGPVLATAYNDEMHRIELVIGLHHQKCAEEIQQLSEGKDVPYSMSCKVKYDVCSICGNKARTRAEYCEHLRTKMGAWLEDGRAVHAINPNPLHFDISWVYRPADRIAYGLRLRLAKKAGCVTLEAQSDDKVVSGAEMAELVGLMESMTPKIKQADEEKLAIVRKLADIEKQIDAQGVPCLAAAFPEGDTKVVYKLKDRPFNELSGPLAEAKVLLPLSLFLALIGADPDKIEIVRKRLPGIYNRISNDPDATEDVACDTTYDATGPMPPMDVLAEIRRLMNDFSLDDDCIRRRTVRIIIAKGPVVRETMKSAGVPTTREELEAELLAREYAKYQVAFLKHACATDRIYWLTAIRNCL